ncbi:cytidine deaminase [Patellaria atrata CBS 101060]|uniref:Cytidine deaminase n=1 Tax=Patellaria atrata CBS 101060 TaxID=1346257 RepID=A0A9P4S5F0_9PEZI|nr:cytidine deaminase [Patellaria atrata CBS 101060]
MSTAAPDSNTAASNPNDAVQPTQEDEITIHGLRATELNELTQASLKAKELAYCPYSLFQVGAAILTTTGEVIVGANVENAAYPVGTCAERVAMGNAVMKGFGMLGSKGMGEREDGTGVASPCGMCRQFIREFCELDTPIFMHDKDGSYVVKTLGELLPLSFGPEALPSRGSRLQSLPER